MAKVLGESGRYVSLEAVKKRRTDWLITFTTVGTFAWISGFLFGRLFPQQNQHWLNLSVAIFALVFILFLGRWVDRKTDSLESERMKLLKGAIGEKTVAIKLDDLPDEYQVVHDLKTPFGNLDHVVVGPTGVFVLDAKNWRGIVENDGDGELLLNGKPTDKPLVRQFIGRVMGIKERTMTLVTGHDPFPFFQPLFVFTSARVEADWGTTANLHCLRDDQLLEYIMDERYRTKLTRSDADKIARAFLALARMDTGFSSNEGTKE